MNYKLTISFLLLVLFCSCHNSNSKILSENKFTEIFRDSLKRKFPTPTYTITQDLEIHVKSRDIDFTSYLTNAYTSYKSQPDSLASVLNMYLKGAGDSYKKVEPIQKNKIIPVIKDAAYIDEIELSLTKNKAGDKPV
jgi:hypothetical protein